MEKILFYYIIVYNLRPCSSIFGRGGDTSSYKYYSFNLVGRLGCFKKQTQAKRFKLFKLLNSSTI